MKHRSLSISILIASIMLVSGCVTNLEKVEKDQVAPSNEGIGYLLVEVDTNVNLSKITLRGQSQVNLTKKDLKAGSNYLLVPLDPGTYYFKRIYHTSYYGESYYRVDQEYFTFQIKPNYINYIGTLAIHTNEWFGFQSSVLVNNSTDALMFMEKEFPNILGQRLIIYSGPGQDRFLEKVHSPTQFVGGSL